MAEVLIDVEVIAQAFADLLGDSIRDSIPARLGNPTTGEVEISLDTVDHPGLVYIHGVGGAGATIDNPAEIDVSSTSTALLLPNKIPPGMLLYNTPILVKRKGELYYVEDLDGIKAIEFLFGLKDKVQRSIGLDQFDYGMTRPDNPASLKVLVSRARYNFDGTIYDIPALLTGSLESYIPGTNLAQAVRVDVDVVNAVLSITAGASTFDDSLTHEQAFNTYYPKVVLPGKFISSWIKLVHDMTQILPPDIYHGQEVYTKDTPNPTKSDILGSIVTAGGEVVVSDGEVVWE